MYEKCIECERLGKDCIPNLYVMSIVEVRDWARERKEFLGLSNAELSEMSGVPKGTIDSTFSKRTGKIADVTYSTFAPLLCALIGCTSKELPCFEITENDRHLSETIEILESENEKLKERICEENRLYQQWGSEHIARIEYMKEQLKWRKQVIVILIIISCVLLMFVLAELCIDWSNRDFGMLWR